MNKETSNKIHLLLRSEKALLRLEMQKKGRQFILVVFASIAILATLVMLNITLYLYFVETMSPLKSAAILTLINAVLSMIFFFMASKQKTSSEAESMYEVRDYALNQLSIEFDEIKEEASEIRDSFSKVSSGISSVFNRDFSAAKALIPLVEMFVTSRKKGSK